MSNLGRSPAFQTFGLPSAKASPAAHQLFAPPAGLPLSHMQASVSTTGNATNKTVHEAWDVGAITIMAAPSVLDGVRGALLNPRPCHVLWERQLVCSSEHAPQN
jgi:hypothetical protein